jgi:hypothetical protein
MKNYNQTKSIQDLSERNYLVRIFIEVQHYLQSSKSSISSIDYISMLTYRLSLAKKDNLEESQIPNLISEILSPFSLETILQIPLHNQSGIHTRYC